MGGIFNRKIFDIGHSRAVTLPASWLKFYERKLGRKTHYVQLTEENGTLVIKLYLLKEPKK